MPDAVGAREGRDALPLRGVLRQEPLAQRGSRTVAADLLDELWITTADLMNVCLINCRRSDIGLPW